MVLTKETYANKVQKPLLTGWRWVRLGEVCEVVSKGTTPTTLGFSYAKVGIPFVRAEDINGSAIDPHSVAFHIPAQADEALSRSRLLPDDFLITIAGTLGRVGYVPQNAPPMNCNQAVAFARLYKEHVDVNYLVLACQCPDVISPLLKLKAGGACRISTYSKSRTFKYPPIASRPKAHSSYSE